MKNLKIINQENLLFNLKKFSSHKLCVMVKANAYGHGLEQIVKLVEKKVECFGVVNIEEGKIVRKYTQKPILICSKVQDLDACKKFNFDVMVESEQDIKNCIEHSLEDSMHLKINCGMNRFGSKSLLNLKIINKFLIEKNLKLKTIYTHFPMTANRRRTKKNYKNFLKLRKEIKQECPICFGGSGMDSYPFDFDILRLGIGMYGYGAKNLKPVMQIESFVMKKFCAERGEYIGYSKKFKVKKQREFAIVPIGYGDGLQRNLSGKFYVKINGKKYKAVGNICMDAFFVKVDENVKLDDTVTILFDAEILAKKAKTISYEILTSFSNLRGKTIIT